MRRSSWVSSLFATLFAIVISVFAFSFPANAQSQWVIAAASAEVTAPAAAPVDPIEQLKEQIIPQIESILTPTQREQLESAILEGGTSIRKAFKSIMLTPEQKTQLAALFKSLPKKDFFTSMTPEQKKQFFLKKKEMFKPTPEEIAAYKTAKDK